MKLRLAGVAFAAALAWIALPADAALAEPTRVLVESRCAPAVLDLFELLYLLRVELPQERIQVGATLDELGAPARPDLNVVLCAEDGRPDVVSLRAGEAPPEAPAETRELDVSGLPENARTRALALALAEIITSTPTKAAAPAQAPSAKAAPQADAQPAKAAPQSPTLPPARRETPAAAVEAEAPRSDTRVSAAIAARAFSVPDGSQLFNSTQSLLYGPELGLHASRWHGGAVLLFGQADAELGSVAIYSATGAIAYDVWRSDALALAARVRGELGVTWASGDANEGARARSAAALAAAGLLELAWLPRIAGPWALELKLAPGYAHGLGALASGHRAATTHGFVLNASAGLSWQLP